MVSALLWCNPRPQHELPSCMHQLRYPASCFCGTYGVAVGPQFESRFYLPRLALASALVLALFHLPFCCLASSLRLLEILVEGPGKNQTFIVPSIRGLILCQFQDHHQRISTPAGKMVDGVTDDFRFRKASPRSI